MCQSNQSRYLGESLDTDSCLILSDTMSLILLDSECPSAAKGFQPSRQVNQVVSSGSRNLAEFRPHGFLPEVAVRRAHCFFVVVRLPLCLFICQLCNFICESRHGDYNLSSLWDRLIFRLINRCWYSPWSGIRFLQWEISWSWIIRLQSLYVLWLITRWRPFSSSLLTLGWHFSNRLCF